MARGLLDGIMATGKAEGGGVRRSFAAADGAPPSLGSMPAEGLPSAPPSAVGGEEGAPPPADMGTFFREFFRA